MPVTMASRFCTLSGVLLTGAASPEPAERASGKWFPRFNPLYVSMTRLVVALRVPGWAAAPPQATNARAILATLDRRYDLGDDGDASPCNVPYVLEVILVCVS